MKKIIIFLFILFLSFEVSFAFSFDENSNHNGITDKINAPFHKLNKYSFNSNDLIKDYKNESQYSVQILSNGKNIGPNECVRFYVNGVNYTKTTNEDGIATLNINLKPGNYIVYSEYKTFKNYNNILVI